MRFFGHRRWLRATTYVFTLSTSIMQFLVRALGGKPAKIRTEAAQRLYGNRAISVIVRSPGGFRVEAAQRWCGDHGAARAGIVRCHLRHVYGLRTYNFSNLYNLPLNKIVEAVEPVNPYENLTAASCLRTEASQRPHGKGDMGSIDP